MRRKEKTMIIFSIIGVILSLSGITYAYLRTRNEQEDKNIITTLTCLNISLENIKEGIKLNYSVLVHDWSSSGSFSYEHNDDIWRKCHLIKSLYNKLKT